MSYEWLKILHVVSSSWLIGGGIGSIVYFLILKPSSQKNLSKPQQFVYKMCLFTTFITACFQPISGFALVYLKPWNLTSAWWSLTGLLYGLVGMCWVVIIYLRMKTMKGSTERGRLHDFFCLLSLGLLVAVVWMMSLIHNS